MIKFYLFKSDHALDRKTFDNIITSFYQGEFDITYLSDSKGYLVTEERFAYLISETLPIINNDLGTKLVIVCAHTYNEVSDYALNFAFDNLHGFNYLSDVIIELMTNNLETIRRLIVDEFQLCHHDLILTAQAYLKTGLNAKAASEMLYIHRNTFNYRLAKFIELTNLDIRDYWNAFYFNLYLRLLNK